MRINNPVTNVEFQIDGSRSIYSTTDLKGNITYANPYFIEVSGFAEEELMGAPQNIVRHPDMPPAAFADLWATIKSGRPWTGFVKNRRKNGDHYWVRATVTPVMANGVTTGYISVRTKPTREQIDFATRLYKDEMKNPGSLVLRQGRVVRWGALGKLLELARISLGSRVALTQCTLLALFGAIGWMTWSSEAIAASGLHVWLSALVAVAMTATAANWYYLAAQVVAPIKQALKTAQGMAGGDLTTDMHVDRTDEIGQLMRAVSQLNSNLNCIIGDIRENFEQINSDTRKIAVGNSDLSARTDSQAAALEETAASMEQLAATVRTNAERTHQGSDISGTAMATAKKGGTIMDKVVTTINDISQSSEKISDIVGIINGIASQTNLLALNAAVEAARAGDAGRGFAVVATEVRELSQRSAAAAKEIKELIDNSVEKVNAGKILANDAGKTMQEIIASVSEVTSIITDISSASAEQSTGISQVNDAITEMDEVTQRNAALVEQAASATGGLEQQGSKLMRGLAVFKLRNAQSRKPAAEPPAPAAPAAEAAPRRKKMSEAEAA